jgi:transcriptional regulator
MPRPNFPQGSLPLLVLKILASAGHLHGYNITLKIEELSEDALTVEEGSLYPALHRLEEAGWIKAKWVVTENKRRARVYEITSGGKEQLIVEEERWRSATAAVAANPPVRLRCCNVLVLPSTKQHSKRPHQPRAGRGNAVPYRAKGGGSRPDP